MTGARATQSDSSKAAENVLVRRLGLLALLLAAEWLPISVYVHTGRGGQSLARALVAFAFFFATFAYAKVRSMIPWTAREVEAAPVRWGLAAGHLCSMAMFLGLSVGTLSNGPAWLSALWLLTGLAGIALAGFAFVPPRIWLALVRATGRLWIFALAAAAIAWRFVTPLWSAWGDSGWKPATDLTFRFTQLLLTPFLRDLTTDPAAMTIGTPRFSVTIGGACSGLEGAGLMLVFSAGWLWFFRREWRFPHALILVPAGIAVMLLLNVARIAALILIGNAGAPQIAEGGFHSQAGWISFNLVAVGVALAAERVSWWSRRPATPRAHAAHRNPTAKYLVPFLAILAAGMVSRAASAGFEWLYPLRFIAAAAALWAFRSEYKRMDWRCDWFAPAAGGLVFLLWMSLEALQPSQADAGFAAALFSSSTLARSAWLVVRVLAAVVTVPIAEELAFRGFLIRRIVTADFEAASLRRFTWFAVLLSSLVFGFMHGGRWIAGTVAGSVYAIAMLRRGRIGDAVVAHATTNALIAGTVLIAGKWELW